MNWHRLPWQIDEHAYVFLWDDSPASTAALLFQLGRMAGDKELNLTWYDAAALGHRVRELQIETSNRLKGET